MKKLLLSAILCAFVGLFCAAGCEKKSEEEKTVQGAAKKVEKAAGEAAEAAEDVGKAAEEAAEGAKD